MNDSGVCICCGGAFNAHDRAVCTSCGSAFHLAMRIDISVEECGQVWINDELEALEFGCNHCLEAAGLIAPAAERPRYVRVRRRRPASSRRRPTSSGPAEPPHAI